MKKELVVIAGPTACGKSELAVRLAKIFNGEIVSADSRQVYKGLDIGSGKITKAHMRGVPHYLLDVASPRRKFSVVQFQKLALKKIYNIQRRNKLPFLVGGTGFYIQSVVEKTSFPAVGPNAKLRKELSGKSTHELFLILKKLDPQRARSIDPKNPRRLMRAIEIVKTTNKPVPALNNSTPTHENILQLGVKKSGKELHAAIRKRLIERLAKGMVTEVRKLHRLGLSWKRLEELGLEYRFVAQYLQQKLTYQEMIATIQKEIEHFAKRQMTWFKKDKRIHWIRNYQEAQVLVKKFLQ